MTESLRAACASALHVLHPDGSAEIGEKALLYVYAALGYQAATAPFAFPPLSWAAKAGYRVVAGNRRFFARYFFRAPEDQSAP